MARWCNGDEQRIHVTVYLRTLGVALTVTLACLALGFPIAYLLAHLKDKTRPTCC
jgi:putative spermidine/putrescine transport system permease protein